MGLLGEDGKPVETEPKPDEQPQPLTPEAFYQARVDAIAAFLSEFSAEVLTEPTRKALAEYLVKHAEDIDPILRPVVGPRVEVEFAADGKLSVKGPQDPGTVKRLLQAGLEEVTFAIFKVRMLKAISAGVAKPALSDVLKFGKRGL